MQGQDTALLLKLAVQDGPRQRSKDLAQIMCISPSEVSKALKGCVEADLLYIAGPEKRVNRSALMEFLSHGLKYVFPPRRGSMVRGLGCRFAALDILAESPEGSFGFVFDRGCFHLFDEAEEHALGE